MFLPNVIWLALTAILFGMLVYLGSGASNNAPAYASRIETSKISHKRVRVTRVQARGRCLCVLVLTPYLS